MISVMLRWVPVILYASRSEIADYRFTTTGLNAASAINPLGFSGNFHHCEASPASP